MLLEDQLDLLIFLETTLLLYFLIEFTAIQSPQFDSSDWWTEGSACYESAKPPPHILALNLTHNEIAFGSNEIVATWKSEQCSADEDTISRLYTTMIAGFAIILTMATCYLYTVRGALGDNIHTLRVQTISWGFYFKTFLGPYLVAFCIASWLALIIVWFPCCYDAGTLSIGVCFVISLIITYFLPYLDSRFSKGFQSMMDSEVDRGRNYRARRKFLRKVLEKKNPDYGNKRHVKALNDKELVQKLQEDPDGLGKKYDSKNVNVNEDMKKDLGDPNTDDFAHFMSEVKSYFEDNHPDDFNTYKTRRRGSLTDPQLDNL